MRRLTIALDFDGVLHSYKSPWKNARHIPDPAVPGAIEWLLKALDHFEIAIYSSRSNQWGGRSAMKRWLASEIRDYLWRRYDETPPSMQQLVAEEFWGAYEQDEEYWRAAWAIVRRIKFPRKKPPAHLLIDDRAYCFRGEWPALEELRAFKPWNKAA
jgi:FMN phosphatase YigB (HAD superfamily)